MPVPKGKQKLYGKIYGHMLNMGKSKRKAKAIVERALGLKGKGRKKKKK